MIRFYLTHFTLVLYFTKKVIWFTLQIMPGFYMECWAEMGYKRVFITADFKLESKYF